MATWLMISFQDSNSPFADNLISFHNLIFLLMLMIISSSLYITFDIIMNKYSNRYLLKNHTIEILWTVMPMMILLLICFPSLKILYYIDEVLYPFFTIKIEGHQWYWVYEYSDFGDDKEFDSYMLNDLDNKFQFRLLDVDNRMVVPINMSIRLIVTSWDVIHSWTIPSLGIKIDAIPGRLNQTNLYCYRPGIYYGQCSEICGEYHSFMPIVLESTSFKNFMNWINKFNW